MSGPRRVILCAIAHPFGLDLAALLDVGEAEMKDAPDRLQWAMNHCLAQIGIEHAGLRDRAMGIGERLEVLKDYPTPPGCTSPFAPVWIDETVRRRQPEQGASMVSGVRQGRREGEAPRPGRVRREPGRHPSVARSACDVRVAVVPLNSP
ncbi:hypothetical protein J2X68_005852 [Streptomyces sp. 3330]|nr:hypothetical protein [Streptomyces sp. 3330]